MIELKALIAEIDGYHAFEELLGIIDALVSDDVARVRRFHADC